MGNALLIPRNPHGKKTKAIILSNISILFLWYAYLFTLKGSLEILQEKWPKIYGRIYRVWVAFQAFIDISSPSLMEVNKINRGSL
jgi:hypothetical protein